MNFVTVRMDELVADVEGKVTFQSVSSLKCLEERNPLRKKRHGNLNKR